MDIFKQVANRIVGNWYDYNNGNCIVFSLSESLEQPVPLQLIAKNKTHNASYKLDINLNHSFSIIIEGLEKQMVGAIKIITVDTFIFQLQDGSLMILQRKIDVEFGDRIIRSLFWKP